MSEKFDTTQINGNGSALLDKESLKQQIEEVLQNDAAEQGKTVVEYSDGVMDIPQETIEAFGGDELRARVFYE